MHALLEAGQDALDYVSVQLNNVFDVLVLVGGDEVVEVLLAPPGLYVVVELLLVQKEAVLLGLALEVFILDDVLVVILLHIVVHVVVLLRDLGVEVLAFHEVVEGGPEEAVELDVDELVLLALEVLVHHAKQQVDEQHINFRS